MTHEVDDELLDEAPSFEPEPVDGMPGPSAANEGARIDLAVRILRQTHDTLGHVISLLEGADAGDGVRRVADLMTSKHELARAVEETSGSRTFEGVFDGANMIGSDGNSYPVPPNYASKSRLVEGDVLKLTIRADGTLVYKQIGPVERRRVVGCVAADLSTGSHVVVCGENTYKVLPASLSYYKADAGDEAVVLVPKSRGSVWAAVEHIVKK